MSAVPTISSHIQPTEISDDFLQKSVNNILHIILLYFGAETK